MATPTKGMIKEEVVEKWEPMLAESEMCPSIQGYNKKRIVAQLLENQEKYLLGETGEPTNVVANAANWDPVLISMVRRSAPNLIAYDLCGVQPMSGPTGQVFALTAHYDNARTGGQEALFNEANTAFTGTGVHAGTDPIETGYSFGTADATANKEGNVIPEMSVQIRKLLVEARTRSLKASYSVELAQDMQAIHGLSADQELSTILANEINAEVNREVIRSINWTAKVGSQRTAEAGIFDLNVDADGRWSAEKFKGLLFHLHREAGVIARETRRGKGNFVLCSSDVATALSMNGVLDPAPGLSGNLNVDDTGNTFAGVLNGGYKVYIDPYFEPDTLPDTNSSSGPGGATAQEWYDYMTIGFKGATNADAGLFYCPYIPLMMQRTTSENSAQPNIFFKTRYGMAVNPFVWTNTAQVEPGHASNKENNQYFRKTAVFNLL